MEHKRVRALDAAGGEMIAGFEKKIIHELAGPQAIHR
jgi:hypothetical protein